MPAIPRMHQISCGNINNSLHLCGFENNESMLQNQHTPKKNNATPAIAFAVSIDNSVELTVIYSSSQEFATAKCFFKEKSEMLFGKNVF